MEQELVELILSEDEITDIIDDRIFPHGQSPQDTALPCLVYQVSGIYRPVVLGGQSVDLVQYQVSITGMTKDENDLRDLMDALETLLHNHTSGNLKSITVQEIASNPNPDDPETFSETHSYSVWFDRG